MAPGVQGLLLLPPPLSADLTGELGSQAGAAGLKVVLAFGYSEANTGHFFFKNLPLL